jgi:hypothetical protein
MAIGLEEFLRQNQLVLVDLEVEVADESQYLEGIGVSFLIESAEGMW